MSQKSDAHSVSSGLSNNSNSIPPLQKATATSSSVASSSQPPPPPKVPIVQNPFETLSSTTATPALFVSGTTSTTTATTTLPPSHVAVRMSHPPQQQSPMKTGTMTSLSLSTPPPTTTPTVTGLPIMGSHSTVSIPVVPQQPPAPFSANTTTQPTSIPSPMASPPPPMNPSFHTSSNANNNNSFPMYEHPSGMGTNGMFTTNHDFMFDDDENTVPSSLGNNTTDDQLSQQQQQLYYRRHPNHHHNHSHANSSEFDPASFPTMVGNSSLTSRIIESTKRFITSGSSHDLHPDPSTTTTPVLTATSLPHNNNTTNAPHPQQQPCLISGYLQKLGRNQKWQTRWFETNGIYLSYYKSSKRSNLLATLDLQKVRRLRGRSTKNNVTFFSLHSTFAYSN